MEQGECPGLRDADIAAWMAAAATNAAARDAAFRDEEFAPVLARLALRQRDVGSALRFFDASLAANPAAPLAAHQAVELAQAGYPREALAHLDRYQALEATARPPRAGMMRVHARVLASQQYWRRELRLLRLDLVEASRHPGNTPTPAPTGQAN
jgi:hypothetical protein